MYRFDLKDGVTLAKDITTLLSNKTYSVIINVKGSSVEYFSYQTVEMFRNYFVMTR